MATDVRKYATGNDVPSYSTKDLFDDTLILDALLNEETDDTIYARDGETELTTWYTLQNTVDTINTGYEAKVDYSMTQDLDLNSYSLIDSTGDVTIGDTMSCTGAATFASTMTVTGAATMSSTLSVAGNVTVTGTVTSTGGFKISYSPTNYTRSANTALANFEGIDDALGDCLSSSVLTTTLADYVTTTVTEDIDMNGNSLTDTTGNVTVDDKLDVTDDVSMSGNLDVTGVFTAGTITITYTPTNYTASASTPAGNFEGIDDALADKQDTLVSGTNIVTINGNSLLGSSDLTIEDGISDNATITVTAQTISTLDEITGTVTDSNVLATSNILINYVGSTALDTGLILMAEVVAAGSLRWKIFNATASDITLSSDITLNYKVID